MDVNVVAERVRAEFEEMPGLTLTVPQASRLFVSNGTFVARLSIGS